MGRPRELSDEERAKLIAAGYRKVEMWVLDWTNPKVVEDLKRECVAINEADRKSGEAAYLDETSADLWDDLAG